MISMRAILFGAAATFVSAGTAGLVAEADNGRRAAVSASATGSEVLFGNAPIDPGSRYFAELSGGSGSGGGGSGSGSSSSGSGGGGRNNNTCSTSCDGFSACDSSCSPGTKPSCKCIPHPSCTCIPR
jgi:hypothetical protein